MITEKLWKQATITVREAAEILDIGRSTAYEAVRRGEIASKKIGSRHLVLTAPLRQQLGLGTYAEYQCACRADGTRRAVEQQDPAVADPKRPRRPRQEGFIESEDESRRVLAVAASKAPGAGRVLVKPRTRSERSVPMMGLMTFG